MLTNRKGAVIATEGAMVSVQGDEGGGDTCWATILEHSLDLNEISGAYVGGLARSGVCLVLFADDQLLELKFPDGWDYDLVDGRMVVRDSEGNVVMGEGDRVALSAMPEREHTGSFCSVGDDIVRVSRVLEVWH